MLTIHQPRPDELADVREQVRNALRGMGIAVDGEVGAAVVIVADELAVNAVTHARTPFAVSVEPRRDDVGRDVVHIAVTDGAWSVQGGPETVTDGRPRLGLPMVRALCVKWGIETCDEGKTVWADVRR
ncbi:ATP-binding protein [Pseudonocardia sp.]|uniref:ATP-binding protein n=1 Tax=Pseudonocardia sp. TaxID=60912 RepID=UPI003D10604A